MRAFVLLKLDPGSERHFMQQVGDIPAVHEACIIHGPYDCIIELRADDLERIHDSVLAMRELPGVADTMTCLVTRSLRPKG